MEEIQAGDAPDLLLLDLPQGDADGLHILRWLRRLRPELPVILICDADDALIRQEAVRLGATDCLVKPVEAQRFEMIISHHVPAAGCTVGADITSDDVEKIDDEVFFIAASPIMRKLRAQVELLAVTKAPVLIVGESGSGKEAVARLIHKLSVRSGFGFSKVNCAALPSDLLEAELFGYERSETGLLQSKRGKLELCENGTILLDEITEMPMALQAKIVQVLQHKRFVGIGGVREFDVRILASSTTNIEPAISENRLREDLYYLLTAYTVHVPPLRQRLGEIPLLLRHFMHHLARHYGLSSRAFSPVLLQACQAHSWPGNLRELESFVKRYLMGAQELELRPKSEGRDMTSVSSGTLETSPAGSAVNGGSLKSLVQSVKLEAERTAIAAALEKTSWNRKAAARLLKVSYRTLLYKIEQYQMSSPAPVPGRNGFRANGNGFRGNGNVG